MKTILIVATLFLFGQANAQCVRLYVKEHLIGLPICKLSSGDWIEICEQSTEVIGCPRSLYIYQIGSSIGSFTYKLSLDRGWPVHYMTLMVNPTTRRFGFEIEGQSAVYSYYTEEEWNIEIQKAKKLEEQRTNEKIGIDNKKYPEINASLARNDLKLAESLIYQLNYPQSYPQYETFNRLNFARKKEEDQSLSHKIDSLLKINLPEQAAKLFSGYHFPSQEEEIKMKVWKALEKYINDSNITQTIIEKDLMTFISANKKNEFFLDLSNGANEIVFNQSGLALINGKLTDLKAPIQYKYFGKNNEFKLPISAIGTLNVSVQSDFLGMPYLATSRNSEIWQTGKGRYYVYTWLGAGWFHEKVSTKFISDIPKNEIWEIQDLKVRTFINNELIINEFTKIDILGKHKLKRRIGTKIRRSLILTGLFGSMIIYASTNEESGG